MAAGVPRLAEVAHAEVVELLVLVGQDGLGVEEAEAHLAAGGHLGPGGGVRVGAVEGVLHRALQVEVVVAVGGLVLHVQRASHRRPVGARARALDHAPGYLGVPEDVQRPVADVRDVSVEAHDEPVLSTPAGTFE